MPELLGLSSLWKALPSVGSVSFSVIAQHVDLLLEGTSLNTVPCSQFQGQQIIFMHF